MQNHTDVLSIRQFGPAIAGVSVQEKLRAAMGAFVGVLLIGACAIWMDRDTAWGLILIAPYGASAVLLFGLPNSPLAQPWSAVVGNGVSAMVGVAATLWVDDPVLRAALASGGAVLMMHMARALHPPGGAVALSATLLPETIQHVGFLFVLSPVLLGTTMLVLIAIVWARLTGRHYPFRQTTAEAASTTQVTRNPLGLSRDELGDLLSDFRQSTNIGVEDLARILAGAEDRAASLRLGSLTCGQIMSRDLVTVRTTAPLVEVAELFVEHGFTSLPVVDAEGNYQGLIFQLHLIRRASQFANNRAVRFLDGFRILVRRDQGEEVPASAIMATDVPRFVADDPVLHVLPTLAHSATDAVVVLQGARAIGVVTRTDLVDALARALAERPR